MRQYGPEDDFKALHGLMTRAFAAMEGRIDPPTSLNRLTPDELKALSRTSEIWVIEDQDRPVACVILTSQDDALYMGKMAVEVACRGQGLGRQLLNRAEAQARAKGLTRLTLRTRIELIETHAAFTAMGFRKVGESAHPGFDRPTSIIMARAVTPLPAAAEPPFAASDAPTIQGKA